MKKNVDMLNDDYSVEGVLSKFCIIAGHNPLTGETVFKTAFSQFQGFAICNQLSKEGYKDISYNFEIMDSLYKVAK
ncbi:MAG: hypothetical protein RSC10_09750 [Longicatena sp.]